MAYGYTRHRAVDLLPIVSMSPGATITTSPAEVFNIHMHAPGTYLIEAVLSLKVGTVTGTRTTTWQFDITELVSMSLGCIKVSTSANSGADPITASGSSHTLGLSTNQRGDVRIFGHIVVNAHSDLTVTASIAGDTATLQACSYVKATPLTFHTHP